MFFGATDALLDSGTAALEYKAAIQAINSSVGGGLLVCYGFLGALYIQQDAVSVLSKSVGMDWKADRDKDLHEIREIRNRLAGHPANAATQKKFGGGLDRRSSAIINYNAITPSGFDAAIYYEDEFKHKHIASDDFLQKNLSVLTRQLLAIEQKMDDSENKFRAKERNSLFSPKLENPNFQYLIQKLNCDLSNSDQIGTSLAHASMLSEKLTAIRSDLIERKFKPINEKHIRGILDGLNDLSQRISAAEQGQRATDYDQNLF